MGRLSAASKLFLAGMALASGVAAHGQSQDSLWNEEAARQGRTIEQGRDAAWYFAQHRKLSNALATIAPQRKGFIDAYVLVVGLDSDPVFAREGAETARVLTRRYAAQGRALLLTAGEDAASAAAPHASPASLATALGAIASKMDGKEDVLVLYITAHGTHDLGLAYRDEGKGMGFIGASRLGEMLDGLGIKRRLVMVSACYSGIFVPALQNDSSVVLTAASAERPSFGCNPGNDWTFFGDALVNGELRQPKPLEKAVVAAYLKIAEWERERGLEASSPQSHFGINAASWLSVIDKRVPLVATARTGQPAASPLAAALPASTELSR